MPPTATGPTPAIPSGSDPVQIGYGIGASPLLARQGAAASFTGAATITTDQLATGILEFTGSAATVTLPTAALLDAAIPSAGVDSSFDFSITATTGIATLAVGTGITAAAGCRLTTAVGTASRYRLRKTGTAAWTLYLVA